MVKFPFQQDCHPRETLVRDQDVAATAKDPPADPIFLKPADQTFKIFNRLNRDYGLGRPADLKGRIVRHGSVPGDFPFPEAGEGIGM